MKKIVTSLLMMFFVAVCSWAQSGAEIVEKYKQDSQVQFQDMTEMVQGANGSEMMGQMTQGKITKEQLELFQKKVTKMQMLMVQDGEKTKAIGKDLAELKGYETIDKTNALPANAAMPEMKVNIKVFMKTDGDKVKEMVSLIDLNMMAIVLLLEGDFNKEEMLDMFVNTDN